MTDSTLLTIALGLTASAAAFGLAEWIAIARQRRQRRIADAVLRWYLDDLERAAVERRARQWSHQMRTK
jgi:hypothetical protein